MGKAQLVVGQPRTLLDGSAKLGKATQCQLENFGKWFIFFFRILSVRKGIPSNAPCREWDERRIARLVGRCDLRSVLVNERPGPGQLKKIGKAGGGGRGLR